MSKEQLKALFEKVASDTELSDKIGAATTAEAVIEIAKAAGFSITSEDIQLLLSLLSEVSEEEEELTDDDLENVAGGGWGWDFLQPLMPARCDATIKAIQLAIDRGDF